MAARLAGVRAEMGDPVFTVDDGTLIVAREFRLAKRIQGPAG